tara:strand:+ start:225 stop:440 length:216 start_codon:yes stop_codon:yes gene_type:complete
LQVDNSQKAVYDAVEIMMTYIEMNGDVKRYGEYRAYKAQLGSDYEIPTRWSKFANYCKIKYLEIKKILAFE